MENIINLLWQWRFVIVLIIAIGVYEAFEWSNFKSVCYGLMLQAKRYAKDKVLESGYQQVEWVIDKAYQFLPTRLTIFISKDLMRRIVQYLYSKLKDYLDDGQVNNSIE